MPTTTVTTFDADGNIVANETVEIPQEQANADMLAERAIKALAANRSFLAKANPTNAEVIAQVKLLTREASGIIRLLLRRFEDIDDA